MKLGAAVTDGKLPEGGAELRNPIFLDREDVRVEAKRLAGLDHAAFETAGAKDQWPWRLSQTAGGGLAGFGVEKAAEYVGSVLVQGGSDHAADNVAGCAGRERNAFAYQKVETKAEELECRHSALYNGMAFGSCFLLHDKEGIV